MKSLANRLMMPASAVAILASAIFNAPAAAQCDSQEVIAGPTPPLSAPGANNLVLASVNWDPDGPDGPMPMQLVIGGTFTQAGGGTVNRVARWDGSVWIPFGSGFNGTVNDLAVVGTDLYAAGSFTLSGATSVNRVARWTGGTWAAVGSGFNGEVLDIENYDGVLYAGGRFTASGATTCNRIARFNGANWQAVGAGTNGDVHVLRSLSSILYVGGSFTSAGGVSSTNITRYVSSTNQWLGMGATNGTVLAIERGAPGEVFIGGTFTTINITNISSPGIGLWRTADNAWSTAGIPGFSCYALHRHSSASTTTYAAGSNGTNMVYARSGSTWAPVGSPAGAGKLGYTLNSFEGELVVGGTFNNIAGGFTLNNIARWHSNTWHPLTPHLNGVINAFTVWNNRLIVGGDFAQTLPPNGEQLGGLLGWNNTQISPVGQTNGTVTALGLSQTGTGIYDLVVGGVFTSAGGVPANNIAKRTLLEPAVWSALGQGFSGSGGLTGGVFCIQAVPASAFTSTLYAGGIFTASGSTTVNRIARFDGHDWLPLGSGLQSGSPFTWANDMLVYHVPGGGFFTNHLIVGGLFDTAGGVVCNSIARWTGTAWASLGSGVHRGAARGEVDSLAFFNDEVIVGGEFDTAGSTPANNIARWNGTTWLAMGNGVPGGSVSNIAVVDGMLYVSALFNGSSGWVSRILRWNGTAFVTVVPDFEGFVYDIFPYQGRLHVGGSFNYNNVASYTGGVDSPYWIQVACACDADINNSREVDVDDLLAVMAAWGACPVPPAACPADISNSGNVNVDDLLAVITAWGPCQ